MRFFWLAVMVLAAGIGAGCHHGENGEIRRMGSGASAMVPVQGHGKLLSIDQMLGGGTLEIDGKPVTFWWGNEMRSAGTGSDPGGTVTELPFKAAVGDEVYFKGIEMRGEIYITAAGVKKNE